MKNIFISVLLLWCITACDQSPKTAKALINAHLETTGGVENWKRLKTLKTSFQVVTKINGEVVADEQRTKHMQLPDLQKTATFANNILANLTLINGTAGTYFTFEGDEVVGLTSMDPEKVMVKRELDLLKDVDKLSFEKTIWNDRDVYKLTHTETKEQFFYDPKSYLLVASTSETLYGSAVTNYEDYRDIDGYKFPFSETQVIEASAYSRETTIAELVVNPSFERIIFEADKKWYRLVKGEPAPPFKLPVFQDSTTVVTNQLYEGKVLLIDFWATWCKPCIAELPNIRQAYKKYHKSGFEILSISFDNNGKTLQNFLDKKGFPWTNTMVKEGFKSDLAKTFQLASIPKPILIGKDGKIIAMDFDASGENLNVALSEIFEY